MFAKNLKRLRKERGLNQSEVADLIDVGYRTISSWENEITHPTLKQISLLANEFGLTTDQLLGKYKDDEIEFCSNVLKEARKELGLEMTDLLVNYSLMPGTVDLIELNPTLVKVDELKRYFEAVNIKTSLSYIKNTFNNWKQSNELFVGEYRYAYPKDYQPFIKAIVRDFQTNYKREEIATDLGNKIVGMFNLHKMELDELETVLGEVVEFSEYLLFKMNKEKYKEYKDLIKGDE